MHGEKWALLGLALLASLFLSLGVATLAVYNQPLTPLPTRVDPNTLPTSSPVPATLIPETPASVEFVHLPPLNRALTPALDPTAADSGTELAPAPTASKFYLFSAGQSVQGRDIVGYAYPITNSPRGLVLVSGIHGDEMNAWPVLQSIMDDLNSGAISQPDDLSLYFIQSLNPDGTAANKRLNAHNVDLNRNWETYDWRTGIEVSAVDFLPVGGGARPFSEPETQAMRDLLLGLKATHTESLTVLYFHAAVPPNGFVTPGTHLVNGQDLADTPSRDLGQLFADLTSYRYANQWIGDYSVTGDASTWAVAQGMLSLTIELPVRTDLAAEDAASLKTGILEVIQYLAE